LLIDFTWAYNCGTVNSRFESFQTKRDKHEYEGQVLKARGSNLTSQYERKVRLNDVEIWENVMEELNEEFNALKEEINWCDAQREQIKNYLEEASIYEEKARSAKDFSEFNESDLDNAIKYYTKAYNLMKWDSWLSMWMEKQIKDQIDNLNEVKDSYKILKNNSVTTITSDNTVSNSANNMNSWNEWKLIPSYTRKSDELKDAIQWMYDNWLTMYNTLQDFLPYNEITREQASKFFVEFATKVLWKDRWNVYSYNIFSDIGNADPTLKDHIIYANNMWLFKWSNWKFMPFKKLTKAQAIAVVMRMVDWYLDESWTSPFDLNKWTWYARYSEYVRAANYSYNLNEWGTYSNFDTLDSQNITRWDVAILLYDIYLLKQNNCFISEIKTVNWEYYCERLWTWSWIAPRF